MEEVKETKVTIHPIKNRIFVKELEAEKLTQSGIFIPDSANAGDGLIRAKVVAAGPGAFVNGKRVPLDMKVGDIVVIPAYSGTGVDIDGESLVAMYDTDVVAIEVPSGE